MSANLAPHMGGEELDATALLEEVAARQSRDAFVALFRHYGPRLKTYLARRGVAEHVSDELVQEIMLTVWRKARLFARSRGTASAWIFAVARSAFIDRVRHERRPEVLDDDPAMRSDATQMAEPELVPGEGRQVLRALEELPPEQAEVLRQSYYEGLSLQEIADRSTLPLGTVKTRARLGLEKLRERFGTRRSS